MREEASLLIDNISVFCADQWYFVIVYDSKLEAQFPSGNNQNPCLPKQLLCDLRTPLLDSSSKQKQKNLMKVRLSWLGAGWNWSETKS